MERDPYRAGAKRDAKLEKLAEEGHRRIAEEEARGADARSEAETEGERNMRAALGAYYGTPLRTLGLVLIILFPVTLIVVVGTAFLQGESPAKYNEIATALQPVQSFGWLAPVILIVSLPAGIILRTVVPPLASLKRVAAEREWARSVPIELDAAAYFEILASAPVRECHIEIEIMAEEDLPTIDILEGLVGVVDPKARVTSSRGSVMSILSGPISGDTGVSVGNGNGPTSAILRNDKIVAYVHHFVDRVLLPLHESAPIARVTFPRKS